MIVINVDTAGNGRAGALSKCMEAGNELHQFLRCQLFCGAAAEMGTTGPWFVRQPLPTAGCTHSPPIPWDGPAQLPAGRDPGKLEMVPVQQDCGSQEDIQPFNQSHLHDDGLDEGVHVADSSSSVHACSMSQFSKAHLTAGKSI